MQIDVGANLKPVTKKKKTSVDPAAKGKTQPHKRNLGPKGTRCGGCRWLDTANAKIGHPPGAACRLMRGVAVSTPSCDQYTAISIEIADKTMREIDKATGAKSEVMGSQFASVCVTSGLLTTDLIIGGGIAPGRVHIKAGLPHAGKTTEYAETIADCLSRGIHFHVWDSEGAIDWPYFARALAKRGVILEYNALEDRYSHPYLHVKSFDSGDAFYRYVSKLLRQLPDYEAGPPQIGFLVDSAANMTPELMSEKEEASPMASSARMHANGMMLFRARLKTKGGILCFTNHIKEKPGVTFGSPEYMSGGKALHHHADIIEWMRGQTTDMPHPKVQEKGKRVEVSWTGIGRDYFRYTSHTFKKNRRSGSFDTKTWSRVCYKQGGRKGNGIDLAYDAFQFYVMTGQAEWTGRERIMLNLHLVAVEEGKVVHPKWKALYGKALAWVDFRTRVYEELRTPPTDGSPGIFQNCRNQLNSGFALERYSKLHENDE